MIAEEPNRPEMPPLPSFQAVSRILDRADEEYRGKPSYYAWLCETYTHKRAVLAAGLERAGMKPLQGEGGFFLMADTSALSVPDEYLAQSTAAAPSMTRDWALCRWLAIEGGVVAIPASPFYSQKNKELGANLVRFAFCKSDATLEAACDKLADLARLT